MRKRANERKTEMKYSNKIRGIDGRLQPQDANLIQEAICLLSPRWTTAILLQLASGKKRTTELMKILSPISAKTVTTRLNALSQAGLVTRTSFREVPPRVEYELTENGIKLLNFLKNVKTVSKKMSEEELHNWGNPSQR